MESVPLVMFSGAAAMTTVFASAAHAHAVPFHFRIWLVAQLEMESAPLVMLSGVVALEIVFASATQPNVVPSNFHTDPAAHPVVLSEIAPVFEMFTPVPAVSVVFASAAHAQA